MKSAPIIQRFFLVLLLGNMLTSCILSTTAADARNEDVPANLLSLRDNRLSQRDQLLAAKADQMRCWDYDEATLKTLDEGMLMRLSPADRQTVSSARSARMSCVTNHRAAISAIDKAIIGVDKDLVWTESQITRIACQK